jgi:hypothetical protein
MNLQQLTMAYGLVAGKNALPGMELGKLNSTSHRYHSSDNVLEQIVNFKPKQAWITFQSTNIAILNGDLLATYPNDYGLILAAECVSEDGKQSLHIRYDGTEESPWLVKIYEQGNGDEYLFDDVGLLATTRSLGKLHYRRFWHIDAELGAEPCFACFTGFAEYH